MTTPTLRTTTLASLLVLLMTSSLQVKGQIWTPCGGGAPLPRARRGISMNNCFFNRSTIIAFNDVMKDEYRTGLNAVINSMNPDDSIHNSTSESTVTFLCRGLVLMDSFIHEFDHADEALYEFDVDIFRDRLAVAYQSLNSSLTTMVTKCPLLTNAPLQLEEADTLATVSLATDPHIESTWTRFLVEVQSKLAHLLAPRFTGPDRRELFASSCTHEILCAGGTITNANFNHTPINAEGGWQYWE
ncbi:uncharacterized protein LOC129273174 [Lytechinus pictus]|uniref:uncharacterized protein LOC129273174 n=1 Tax=Lytechinus pictus TaxID=7653 RepID=UPI0030BA23DF